jgi:hypothetical protein
MSYMWSTGEIVGREPRTNARGRRGQNVAGGRASSREKAYPIEEREKRRTPKLDDEARRRSCRSPGTWGGGRRSVDGVGAARADKVAMSTTRSSRSPHAAASPPTRRPTPTQQHEHPAADSTPLFPSSLIALISGRGYCHRTRVYGYIASCYVMYSQLCS